jgi:hypothetical protein
MQLNLQVIGFTKISKLDFKLTFLVTKVWTLVAWQKLTNRLNNKLRFKCKQEGML